MLVLPYAYGGPCARGLLRHDAEDFRVEEHLSFEITGSGEHVLLKIRKRGENTRWVTRQLARLAGVPERDVGYAGLKDRNAVTTQWFSVGLAGRPEPDWEALATDSIEVLEVVRHHRKLRPGAIRENRFHLVIRDLTGDSDALAEQLMRLRLEGAPNYFGEQRFGHDAENLDRARDLFSGKLRVRDRKLRGIYLSAARSWIFNAVLAARVEDGSWNRPLGGDAMGLDGRRAVFRAETVDETLRQRVAAQEIHPTGPLWGSGELMSAGDVRRLEDRVAAENTELVQGLTRVGMEQERRPLRASIRDLEWQFGCRELELSFGLSSGSYATVLVRELVDYRGVIHELD